MPKAAPGFSATAVEAAASPRHRRGAIEKFLSIDSHHGRRHHAEIRQRGIPAANRCAPEEHMQKTIRLRYLLHLRSWVGDRHEVAADLVVADYLARALKEILFENIGLERAARFAGNNEQRFRDVDEVFERFHLRGIGGIEHMQSREVRDPAKRQAQHFGAQTGAAHAQQQHMLEAARLHFFRDLHQLIVLRELLVNNVEPAQPTGFVGAGPQGSVALPQALHLAVRLPGSGRRLYGGSQRVGQGGFKSSHRSILWPGCWLGCFLPRQPAVCRRRRRII